MKFAKVLTLSLSLFFLSSLFLQTASAQNESQKTEKFYRGKVVEILEEGETDVAGEKSPYQVVRVVLLSGDKKNKTVEIAYGTTFSLAESQKVSVGDRVIINESNAAEKINYYIIDTDRINPLFWIGVIFLALVVIFGRMRGLRSLFGLLLSLLVLGAFVVPQVAAGRDPLIISIIGALAITLFSLYLSHGYNKRTTIALISTVATLLLAFVLAKIFVSLTRLSGLGAEETFYLQIGSFATLDFKGLLLGGIIIGALGVLDDITTSQVAVVHELHHANTSLSARELYTRGLSVGREHIASLVNTLALAYVGASLPLLLLFLSSDIPFWMAVNDEAVAEEIVRTLVGSTALVCAVPISTLLAARVFGKPRGVDHRFRF